MPCFSVHIACANEFMKKNKIVDHNMFIQGVIDVDLTEDRLESHYSNTSDKSDLKYFLKNRVSIDKYLSKNKITSDYDRGYFFHLLTDYYFYTSFFKKEFISKITHDEFKRILYHDYDAINDYIKNKYSVVFPDCIKKYDCSSSDKPLVLIYEDLDSFIEKMGNIKLEDF